MSLTSRLAARARDLRASPWARELLGFGSSTALDQGVRLVSSLVVAGIVGPVAWGTWYLLNLVLRYGGMVHLGALNGMNREIPAAMGRRDLGDVDRIRGTALGFVLASYAVALAVVALVLVPLGAITPGPRVWLTMALLAGQQLFGFAFMHLKARTEFGAASRLQIVSAITFPLATIPGAYLGGLEGFLAGQIVAYALLGIVAARGGRGLFVPRFDVRSSAKLIRVGFPIMAVGISHAIFATVDRWVIQGALGTEALGQYALAVMALGAVSLLPQVVGQQVYPRMAMAWARDPRWSSLIPLMARRRWTALALTIPIVTCVLIVAPWGIRTFLPEYIPSIPAVVVSMAVPLVNVMGLGYGVAFNVVGLQQWYLVAIFLAAVTNLVVSLALVQSWGLVGVALGTVAGFATLSTALIVLGALVRTRTLTDGSAH